MMTKRIDWPLIWAFIAGILICAGSAFAQTGPQTIGLLTVTNATKITNAQSTITINGATRTWTNLTGFSPSTSIAFTNDGFQATTNLVRAYQQYAAVGSSGSPVQARTNTTNSIKFISAINDALTITFTPGWCSVTFTTNYFTNATPIRAPFTTEPANTQTNLASLLISMLDFWPSNTFREIAPAFANFVSLSQAQTNGNKTITNSTFKGGLLSTNTADALVVTGLVNYTRAIRSDGAGGITSYQAGSNAVASAVSATANGANSTASAANGTATGAGASVSASAGTATGAGSTASAASATATGTGSTASGANSTANGAAAQAAAPSSTVIGSSSSATATATNSTIVGRSSSSAAPDTGIFGKGSSITDPGVTNTIIVGNNMTAVRSNQIMVGSVAQTVTIDGSLEIFRAVTAPGTNGALSLTNILGAIQSAIATNLNVLAGVFTNVSAAFINLTATNANILAGTFTNIQAAFVNFTATNATFLAMTASNVALQNVTSTNFFLTGSNRANAVLLTRFAISSLGVSNNISVNVGTNENIDIQPGTLTASANICGIIGDGLTAGAADGHGLDIINNSGFSLVLSVNTVDPNAASRISTDTGGDVTIINKGSARLRYSTAISRWELRELYPSAGPMHLTVTYGALTSGSYTNLVSDQSVYISNGSARTNWLQTNVTVGAIQNVVDRGGTASGTNLIVKAVAGLVHAASSYTISTDYGAAGFQWDGTNFWRVWKN